VVRRLQGTLYLLYYELIQRPTFQISARICTTYSYISLLPTFCLFGEIVRSLSAKQRHGNKRECGDLLACLTLSLRTQGLDLLIVLSFPEAVERLTHTLLVSLVCAENDKYAVGLSVFGIW
jgi:hypothetical protein